jgi:TatD DNase family protein
MRKMIREGLAKDNKIIAIGICGLDYEKSFYAKREVQKKMFEMHFDIAAKFKLPLYLHQRGAYKDFIDLLRVNYPKYAKSGGLVHCFTGTSDELNNLLGLQLYISLTPLSFKTIENLDVIK